MLLPPVILSVAKDLYITAKSTNDRQRPGPCHPERSEGSLHHLTPVTRNENETEDAKKSRRQNRGK